MDGQATLFDGEQPDEVIEEKGSPELIEPDAVIEGPKVYRHHSPLAFLEEYRDGLAAALNASLDRYNAAVEEATVAYQQVEADAEVLREVKAAIAALEAVADYDEDEEDAA